ncbi:MAG: P-loop NTPase [Planctomycetes bacterium]|jgi:Mrp family chromosome partitioning ATPase/predicted Fe-Mo cluster-binding NifX family protein|nr:P-loop NTPase [Planctomycetota bacterium]
MPANEPNPGHACGTGEEDRKLQDHVDRIRRKIVVLSGKGGVGKSTVAVNLAWSLRQAGHEVGLLDADIHGPSIATLLGLQGRTVGMKDGDMAPIEAGGLKVMSLAFLLPSSDDPVIWRGPMKMGALKQFLGEVAWGDLDFLVIDLPPGTGDEPLSIVQLLGRVDGALIVTTPQKVAGVEVRKSVSFCKRLGVPVLGIVENMSGFVCPHCGKTTHVLRTGGGFRIASDMNVPYLGSIPMDPRIAEACDEGKPFLEAFADSPAAAALREILKPVEALAPRDASGAAGAPASKKEEDSMRIAVPLAGGKLCSHFGHCETFALLDADLGAKKVLRREDVVPPPHEPGLLPKWLAEKGATVILAGGMGSRAQGLFAERGIRVVVGAPAETPERLAEEFLAGRLVSGANVCDH